ncbi:cytochrome P450 [Aspergillus stella-maris]|uniref:cytochrome P450 n=1 Tax=Aspergillus stella-maris TaxID=1810926 RepID=UPI003CCD2AE6
MAFSMFTTAALAGVLSHIAYFKRGEHHLHGVFYLKVLFTTILTSTAFITYRENTPILSALTLVLKFVSSFLAGLYTSVLTYRVLLHPLNKFPGPLPARVSSTWLAAQLNHDLYLILQSYHEKYGNFVRIGSSDISISHPDAVEALYGTHSLCTKGENYELSAPATSLQLIRDPEEHRVRRRVWSGAFSDRLLRGYEQRIKQYRAKLLSHIADAAKAGVPVDIRKWFNMYSFDVMGDLSFGKGFGSLESGEEHWVMKLLMETQDYIGWFLPSWVFVIVMGIPGLTGDFWQFLDYCGGRLFERFKNDPEIPDISTSLFAPLKGRNLDDLTADDKHMLYGDARLIIIAGSDTTSGALSAIFYELARKPEEIVKLRAELDPLFNSDTETKDSEDAHELLNSRIGHLNHLNGVINEALRMYPAVPTQLQRKTPPQGIEIGGTHIPGDMHVFCPLYVVHRSYAHPNEFIPERWYSQPGLIKHKNAFAPFSLGPFNCIGRPLALMNLRATVAELVMEFDVAFKEGDRGEAFVRDARDNFVYYAGGLELVFSKRGDRV